MVLVFITVQNTLGPWLFDLIGPEAWQENPHNIKTAERENKGKFSSAKRAMRIHLDLAVKDKNDGGVLDEWSSDQDFKKYLKDP